MNEILLLIFLPLIFGLLCLVFPKRLSAGRNIAKLVSVVITLATFILACKLFIEFDNYSDAFFLVDGLSKFLIPTISVFGFLVVLFSLKYIKENEANYFGYILCTLGASLGVVVSNDLRLLVVFWGFLGLTLYKLINHGGVNSTEASKKALIIIGGTDALMLVGIAILWQLTGTFMLPENKIQISGSYLSYIAFICLLFAAFAKAGVMPFHTWIPDMAEVSPAPVMAFLPASLDKLLGIYFLTRMSLNIFQLTDGILFFLMLIGAITIICAVFMAMVQHDFRKLLSYHAVSQVGYMVLGIGTGTLIGIAGGIFHMLNHVVYKSCLFLCGGAVQYKTNNSDLDSLGGLAKYMPVTFVTFGIAALAISGVPPLNGFVSKWMIYQAIVTRIVEKHSFWDVIFLVAAVFGSALTLASFMKLIHAIFLGSSDKTPNPEPRNPNLSEVHWTMWLPTVFLAVLCIIFGIFAFQIPLKLFVLPSLSTLNFQYSTFFIGLWSPKLATMLIIVGLIVGLLIYLVSNIKLREVEPFIGGETILPDERVTGIDFYQTIRDMGFFKTFYLMAEKKFFDIYDWGKKIVFGIGGILSALHAGNLHTYIVWCLAGMLVIFYVLLG